ncbi:potassium-transporting ATPase subunit KdpC [Methylomonas sp. MgM2]
MSTYLKPAVALFTLLTLLTGVVYPLLVTALAQGFFPVQANGSLIKDDKGEIIGSELIGQQFSDPTYFWGRPSATSPYPYNAAASSGSNLGPINPALVDTVAARVKALLDADPGNRASIPVDLVTASASGLDPHISIVAAEYQVPRIAKARHIDPAKLRNLLAKHTEGRQWQIFGEPRVNVLKLNLSLAGLGGKD